MILFLTTNMAAVTSRANQPMAYIFSQIQRALIGYFEVTGHLTSKLFPANSF